MNIALKILLTLVCCITSFITIYLLSYVCFANNPHSRFIAYSISIPLSLFIGIIFWRKPANYISNRFVFVLMGGLVFGALGFVLSFYGILLFSIGGNLGPLFSIFFIGPISFIIGLWYGNRYWKRKVKAKQFIR